MSSAAELPPFAVQLAAFRRYSSARAFADEVPAGGAAILGSMRDGQTWYVVVLGLYETQAEAASAEASYRERHPAAATWLRGTADLRPAGG
jgi:septal ring-binding cell division protein DamX